MSKARTKSTLLVLVLGYVVVGCAPASVDDEVTEVRSALTTATFTLPLLVGQNPTDVALAASSTLNVNDRAIVLEQASINDRAMISNVGTTDLSTVLGASTSVGTVMSRGQVFLRINASISGSLYQGGNALEPASQGGFFISGVKKTRIAGFATDTTWTRTVTWPTTFNPPPNLEPGVIPPVVQLGPGAYHTLDVKTGRTLVLNPGEYFLDGLIIEPGAFLTIAASPGPVTIYILDGGLIHRGAMVLGLNTPGMPVPSLTVMTTGSVVLEQPFTGVVIAPNGSIELKANVNTNDPKTHLGAYLGKNVTIFEGNRLLHYRDPFSFRGFGPNDGTPFIGERASVTGGSIRLPLSDVTDDAHQSESVTAITRSSGPLGASYVVTVAYNDQTVRPTNPSLVYTDMINDPRDGAGRLIKKGASLMGWSYSLDEGRTFNYGGRVAPPTGWSIIWGDPSIAKTNIEDPFVYYAAISGTTAKFESVWDPAKQAIVSSGQNVGNALDGYCIARSIDGGITFGAVACEASGFQDGSALAVAVDQSHHRQVYVGGTANRVLRMDGDTMTFSTTPINPPLVFGAGESGSDHPRMKVFDGILYYARQFNTGHGFNLVINRLNAVTNSTTWMGQRTVMCGAAPCLMNVGGTVVIGPGGVNISTGAGFAFEFGPDVTGQTKLRIMLTQTDGVFNGPLGRALNVVECNVDVTNCRVTGWTTAGDVGEEVHPSLRFGGLLGGGRWVAAWRKTDPANPLNTIRQVAGQLNTSGNFETLEKKTLFQSAVPCFYDGPPSSGRLGEYDYIDGFGDGRFFAPYSTSTGCRWHGTWTSDSHLGGSVFRF